MSKNRTNMIVGSSIDVGLILISISLAGIGCLFTYSLAKNTAGPNSIFLRQIAYVVIGLVVMLLISQIDYYRLEKFFYPYYGVLVLLCIGYICIKKTGAIAEWPYYLIGCRRQILSVLFTVTCLVIAVQRSHCQNFFLSLGLGLVSCFLLYVAGYDISLVLALMIVITSSFMLVEDLYFIKTLCSVVVCYMAYFWLVPSSSTFFSQFFETLNNPLTNLKDYSYETIQDMYAIASGGAFGMGYGEGKASYFLSPSICSEDMLAGISQEIGYIGAALILCLLFLWALRAIWIAYNAPNQLGFFLTAIITLRFLALVILHTLSAVNLSPRLSLPLPFVSYGGSEFITEGFLSGIVLSVSRFRCSADSESDVGE